MLSVLIFSISFFVLHVYSCICCVIANKNNSHNWRIIHTFSVIVLLNSTLNPEPISPMFIPHRIAVEAVGRDPAAVGRFNLPELFSFALNSNALASTTQRQLLTRQRASSTRMQRRQRWRLFNCIHTDALSSHIMSVRHDCTNRNRTIDKPTRRGQPIRTPFHS